MNVDFDSEADRIRQAYARRPAEDWRYSWLNPAHVFLQEDQQRAVLSLLSRQGVRSFGSLRVLDVGCGSGHWLRVFTDWGVPPAQLVGVDLLESRIEEARARCAPAITFHRVNAASIPESAGSFDVVLQFTAFSSIIDRDLAASVACEMMRVLKPGGMIVWYDFFASSPNPDVRAIGLAEIARLFPGCTLDSRRLSLAPPIARALAPRAMWLCRLLSLFPFLRTHWLVSIRRAPTAG